MPRTQAMMLAVCLAAAGLAAIRFLPIGHGNSGTQAVRVEPAPAQAASKASQPASLPPDLHALAARLGAGGVPPTPEQIAEERRVEREQVSEAIRALESAAPEERAGGAQQLGAYPTREAERRLAGALAEDTAAGVREAAAQSLAFVKEPDAGTIRALLKSLLDGSPAVRAAALQALATQLNHLDPESPAFRRIRKGLAGVVKTRKLDKAFRQDVRDLLADSGSDSPLNQPAYAAPQGVGGQNTPAGSVLPLPSPASRIRR